MPFTLWLKNDDTPYRVYFWRSREGASTPAGECPDPTRVELENLHRYSYQYVAKGSFPNNKSKFKPLGDAWREIKPSSQLRLLGQFRAEGAIKAFVAVLCIRKKTDQLPKSDLQTAKKRWKQSLQEKLE